MADNSNNGNTAAASDAATTATLTLASAALQALPRPPQNPSRRQQYLALPDMDDQIGGIVSHSETQSLVGDAFEEVAMGERTVSFEEIATAELSQEDQEKRRRTLQRRQEDATLNRDINKLNAAFAPSLLVNYGDAAVQQSAQRRARKVLSGIGETDAPSASQGNRKSKS